ncbi:hypothetical protein BGZ47_009831 [Haplosporangium gracile]|nr:hypothetical protein BGZ47_009831 [Haplosporangium gracile]
MLDESKKDKSKRRAGTDWSREGQRTEITQSMALQRLTDINNLIKDQGFYEARPTWANSAAEAKTEYLFIDCLLDAVLADPTGASGFDADGSGLSELDMSITTTLKGITKSIRQYSVLTKNRFELLMAVENLEESKSSQEQEEATVVLPPVHSITTARQRHKVKDIVLAESRDAAALDHQIEASVKTSNVEPDLSKTVVFEDIPDVAAKPEDANPEIIRSARYQSKGANPEEVRCVTDQPKMIEHPTSKERLNASTKGKGIAIETTEDTGATRSKSKHIVWFKGLRCEDAYG